MLRKPNSEGHGEVEKPTAAINKMCKLDYYKAEDHSWILNLRSRGGLLLGL
jgi:hypothetical protein